jgi:cysteine desulfurase/selenocysteine lyase
MTVSFALQIRVSLVLHSTPLGFFFAKIAMRFAAMSRGDSPAGPPIVSVTLDKSTFKRAPHRFEAGTPNIAGAIRLGAAIDYIEQIGRSAIFEHDAQLTGYAIERFAELPGMRVLGPSGERGAIVGFVMDASHPHDLTTFADQQGLAMRGGHHCNQPLMRRFGLPGTTRASFYFYNTTAEIDRMIDILRAAARFFA